MDKDGYHGYDMSKLTIPDSPKYSFNQPPNNIIFYDTSKGYQREVLRITKDGITANPDVPVDESADAVIRALDGYIKNLTKRTWVGLDTNERSVCYEKSGGNLSKFAKELEVKLKEKNT